MGGANPLEAEPRTLHQAGDSTGTRDYTLGRRLTPAADANVPEVSFGAVVTRRERAAAWPEHMIGLEATARW